MIRRKRQPARNLTEVDCAWLKVAVDRAAEWRGMHLHVGHNTHEQNAIDDNLENFDREIARMRSALTAARHAVKSLRAARRRRIQMDDSA